MMKKRLSKTIWYGTDVDSKGSPIIPPFTTDPSDLDGLHVGELFLHFTKGQATLWSSNNEGKIVQIEGAFGDELYKIFLRKDKDDRSKGKIASDKGFEVGNEGKGFSVEENGTVIAIIDQLLDIVGIQSKDFSMGEFGNGFLLKYDKDKKRSYFEVDELLVRKIAYFVSLVIKELKHVGGTIVLSPASMKCSKVETYDTFYRCYFESEHDGKTINNEFQAGDLARCQTFNVKEGVNNNVRNTYYWRYVVAVGDNYIDLSIADCDSGSGIPQKGDEIVQLGNRYDDSRQNAIILSTVGDDAPSFKQYQGINNYYLSDDNAVTIFSPSNNVIKGKFLSQVTGKDYDEELKKLQVDWDSVLEQTDKEFTMWFFEHTPTLDNIPAVEWDSEELKQLHDQDLFYDRKSGLAYRFEKVGGVWMWSIVTDADTIRALEKAAEADKKAEEVKKNIEEIVSDGILSALEKKEVLKEWQGIASAYGVNIDNAAAYDVPSESYTSAYLALGSYLNGGQWNGTGTPSWLSDYLLENTPINADEYRNKWVGYYDAEKAILDAISQAIDKKVEDVKDNIKKIVSDEILSALEKKEVLKEWESIVSEYSINTTNASKYNVSTDSYTSAYFALGTYLNGGEEDWNGNGTPLWLGEQFDENTSINPDEYRRKWVDYYDARTALLDTISDVIKGIADNKKRVFVSQPSTPYDVGDMWVNAIGQWGEIEYKDDTLVCITSRQEGESFHIGDWRLPNGYSKATFEATDEEIRGIVKRVEGDEQLISDIKQTAEEISATVSKIQFDENWLITSYSKAGLLIEDDFAGLFVEQLDNEIKTGGKISIAISNGIVNATIQADQVLIGGNVKINDVFTVDTQGNVTANDLLIYGELNVNTPVYNIYVGPNGFNLKPSIEFNHEGFVYAYMGMVDDYYETTGGNIFLRNASGVENNLTADRIVINAGVGSCTMTASGVSAQKTNDSKWTDLNYGGLSLYGGASISRFAIQNFGYMSESNLHDFNYVSSSITMPDPSLHKGRVIWVKGHSGDVTLTCADKLVKYDDTAVSSSIEINRGIRIFVSDGNYWFECKC